MHLLQLFSLKGFGYEDKRATTRSDRQEDEEPPKLSLPVVFALLVVVGVRVTFTAGRVVESVGGLVGDGWVSKEFPGLILLPIVCNAVQHVSAHSTDNAREALTSSLYVATESIIVGFLPLFSTIGLPATHVPNSLHPSGNWSFSPSRPSSS